MNTSWLAMRASSRNRAGHTAWIIFFSGLLSKVTKGIAVFAISLVSVDAGVSYPMQVRQVVRTEAEKKASKAKSKKKSEKKRGRLKGSKNRDKTLIEWTPEMVRLYDMIQNQLATLKNLVSVRYLALDGHFGNNNALQTTRRGADCIWSLNCVTILHSTSFILVRKKKKDLPKDMGRKSLSKDTEKISGERKS